MQDKETLWHQKRLGKITSSNLHLLNTSAPKWTKTAISYLYSLQRQRLLKQPKKSVVTYAMQIGIDNEPYAVEWIRENLKLKVEHCDVDFDEKVFIETDWGLGDSPDGYVYDKDEKLLLEIKCLVTDGKVDWFFSPTVPYDKKKDEMFKEHKNQLAGHLLAHPDINKVMLMIYDPQDDDDMNDLRSPLCSTRGLVFIYDRAEFGDLIETTKERVIIAEEWLQSGKDLDEMMKIKPSIKNE